MARLRPRITHMKKILITLLFVFATTMAYSQDEPEMKVFTKGKFTFSYPATWEVDDSGFNGTQFLVMSPLAGDDDSFQENVNLIEQDLSGTPMTLDGFIDLSIGQLTAAGADMLESSKTEDDPTRHRQVFTLDSGGLTLKFIQYYWLQGDYAYVLTFTSMDDTFDQYMSVAEEIAKSLKVK